MPVCPIILTLVVRLPDKLAGSRPADVHLQEALLERLGALASEDDRIALGDVEVAALIHEAGVQVGVVADQEAVGELGAHCQEHKNG